MNSGYRWSAYTPLQANHGTATDPGHGDASPELADVGRLARRFVRRAVAAARAQDAPVRQLLLDHLGPGAASAPVVSGSWPAYDHVNVQAGLDSWLSETGRQHELAGLIGFRQMMYGLSDLLQAGPHTAMVGVGGVALTPLEAGPGGEVLPCVQRGLYLIEQDGARLVLLLRGPDEHGPSQDVTVEICAADQALARRARYLLGQLPGTTGTMAGPPGTTAGTPHEEI